MSESAEQYVVDESDDIAKRLQAARQAIEADKQARLEEGARIIQETCERLRLEHGAALQQTGASQYQAVPTLRALD